MSNNSLRYKLSLLFDIFFRRRKMFKKSGLNFKLVTFALLFVFCVGNSLPVLGEEPGKYQNPPREEIARKLEAAAQKHNIPCVIFKAIAYKESGWRQFDEHGQVVMSASDHPALGIMQIASYNPEDTEEVERLKYDIDYNIERGAEILIEKWNMTPRIGNGEKNILENWYFAIWAYNHWSEKNNPNNNPPGEAYQDKVLRIASTSYFPGLTTPVNITPIPPELLPPDTTDYSQRHRVWDTPTPFTVWDPQNPGGGNDTQPVEPTALRIAGQNRLETANQVALTGWPEGADTVILARADDFPDTLAGVPLAYQYQAPILITPPQKLDPGVINTLQTLKPAKVIILGGETAVSKEVEESLKSVLSPGSQIRRIGGANRYETSALIAQEIPAAETLVMATGEDFPDALSLAAVAGAQEIPLLLTPTSRLAPATAQMLKSLKPKKIYIAGGEQAVSAGVETEVRQITNLTPADLTRFAGANRYETSIMIAEKFYPTATEIYVAGGSDFPDGLAAGAWAAKNKGCLLLVYQKGFAVNGPTENYLRKIPNCKKLVVIGGQERVAESTFNRIKELLKL
jgi:putative cell wall-binding protein